MRENRLYNDLAWTWPIISPPENYIKESEEYRKLILKYAKRDVKTLLHLGCGGGHNDCTLKRYFEVTGVDVSSAMLDLARKLNPEVTYLEGDMRAIRLGQTFDTVCILDSIDYMLTVDDLSAAFKTACDHLKPGGVFLTGIEEKPDTFKQNKTMVTQGTKEDLHITLIENLYDPDLSDTTYQSTLVFLIRQGEKLAIEVDRHLLGIFSVETWIDLMTKVGFEVKLVNLGLDDPHYPEVPMLIGIKPLEREKTGRWES